MSTKIISIKSPASVGGRGVWFTQYSVFVLLQEFELRKQARSEGRRYCNTGALTYQAERMPEQIRLNVRYGSSI